MSNPDETRVPVSANILHQTHETRPPTTTPGPPHTPGLPYRSARPGLPEHTLHDTHEPVHTQRYQAYRQPTHISRCTNTPRHPRRDYQCTHSTTPTSCVSLRHTRPTDHPHRSAGCLRGGRAATSTCGLRRLRGQVPPGACVRPGAPRCVCERGALGRVCEASARGRVPTGEQRMAHPQAH